MLNQSDHAVHYSQKLNKDRKDKVKHHHGSKDADKKAILGTCSSSNYETTSAPAEKNARHQALRHQTGGRKGFAFFQIVSIDKLLGRHVIPTGNLLHLITSVCLRGCAVEILRGG